MDKYTIAPPAGSTNNSVGASDRPWHEGHFDSVKLNGGDLGEYLAESTGYGIVSGCEPSISGLTVTVAAGVVHLADGTRKEIASTNITLDAADASNPRIDLVYIDSTGTVAKITGTAAASPSAPAVPANGISVAQVSVAASATTGTVTNRGALPRYYNAGIVTIQDFGGVGDGVADDTLAVQAAVDSGKKIIINGRFRITAPIIIKKSINIAGSVPQYRNTFPDISNAQIIVDLAEDGTGIIFDIPIRGVKFAVRDISIMRKWNNTNLQSAIKLKNQTSNGLFENIVISQDFQKGIILEARCWSLMFNRISIYECNDCAVEMTDCTGIAFNQLDIFDSSIGVKASSSNCILNQGDFENCVIGLDASNECNIRMIKMGAEVTHDIDGADTRNYIKSDGSCYIHSVMPSFFLTVDEEYNIVSIKNGSWRTPVIIDGYNHKGNFNIHMDIDDDTCSRGCVKLENFTSDTLIPMKLGSSKLSINGTYGIYYTSDGVLQPGSLSGKIVGYEAKEYSGFVKGNAGNLVFYSEADEINGEITFIKRNSIETIGFIYGQPSSTPQTFNATFSNHTLTVSSSTDGFFKVFMLIRKGYATPSDYPEVN